MKQRQRLKSFRRFIREKRVMLNQSCISVSGPVASHRRHLNTPCRSATYLPRHDRQQKLWPQCPRTISGWSVGERRHITQANSSTFAPARTWWTPTVLRSVHVAAKLFVGPRPSRQLLSLYSLSLYILILKPHISNISTAFSPCSFLAVSSKGMIEKLESTEPGLCDRSDSNHICVHIKNNIHSGDDDDDAAVAIDLRGQNRSPRFSGPKL